MSQPSAMTGASAHSWIPLLAVLYAATIAAVSVAISTHSYGPWPDEMWGYTYSVGFLRGEAPNSVLTFPAFGDYLPLVGGNYQGALRLYLHILYLMVTGDAAIYQRAINTVMLIAVCAAMCWTLAPVVTRRWLLALLPLLALSDPNYVVFAQTDMGPFLIQNLFTVLSLGFLLRASLNESPRSLAWALFFASMVVADKLTGIPVAVGLGVACFVVALRKWSILLRPRWLAMYSLALVVPLLPTFIFLARAGGAGAVTVSMTGKDTLIERVVALWGALQHVLAGNDTRMIESIYSSTFALPAHYWFAFALLAVVAIALIASRRGGSPGHALALVGTVLVPTAAVFVTVPGLTRLWHYLILNPLFYMALALVAFIVMEAKTRGVLAAAALLIGVNFAVAQSNLVRALMFQSKHSGTELASMAIYPLIAQLKARGIKQAACFDYGPCISIYLLTAGTIKMRDYAFDPDFSAAEIADRLSKPHVALVLREIKDIPNEKRDREFQRGTRWFQNEGQSKLPPLKIDWLDPVGDTRYGIAVLN